MTNLFSQVAQYNKIIKSIDSLINTGGQQNIDILICTPGLYYFVFIKAYTEFLYFSLKTGRLLTSLKNGDILLNDAKAIVLDEADVLFLDDTFPLQGNYSPCLKIIKLIYCEFTKFSQELENTVQRMHNLYL